MLIKILAIVFPTLLFVFKYVLPSLAKTAVTKKKFETTQIIIELIHFPVDLLFVAISYSIPKILELLATISSLNLASGSNPEELNILIIPIFRHLGLAFLILFLIPFYVFAVKIIEKLYFIDNKIGRIVPFYIVAFVLVGVALFL